MPLPVQTEELLIFHQEIKYLHSTEVYAAKIENKWNLVNKNGEVLNSIPNEDSLYYEEGVGLAIGDLINIVYNTIEIDGEVINPGIYMLYDPDNINYISLTLLD